MDGRLTLPIRGAALAAAAALLPGCYYGHLAKGQLELLSRRVPIAEILADPGADAAFKHRLERALDARAFASRELALPDNASYTTYADLDRRYALWNVFTAPELSLEPHEWCYLMVGCLAYRGFYDRERADATARGLRDDGFDVFVAGVRAYSTLGWFDDPLLSTMGAGEDVVAGIMFHELAHQAVFADGDTAFNESYASFVEQEGLRRYLAGAPVLAQQAQRRLQRESEQRALMRATRERLEAVYASAASDADKRERKHAEFEHLRQEAGLPPDAELNNATLLPYGLYHAWVPAFARLFEEQGGDWRAFHRAAGELAELDEDERRQRLAALAR